MDKKSREYLDNLRHSTAHLLAAAVLELWPHTKKTIGPSIENGFYFDFDFGDTKVSEDDFSKIESKMKELIGSWKGFERVELSKSDALEEYKHNEYKKELIEEFASEGQTLTLYKSGEYSDLCRGGHVEHPNSEIKHFKLLSIAGAYWRGSEKNKMLTRIYGTVFPTKVELDAYLHMLEEARKRDHKKLGRELGLFMFHETAPGMPYWLPKGVVLLNTLIEFWRIEHRNRGYQEIKSPLMNKKELYETSGHWDHYLNDMFLAETKEKETYALKPMNCPNAMVVFGSEGRSYRELPLRLSDTDTLHRFELSGTLNGLLRAREFSQDDAHIFVTEDMIQQEFQNLFDLTERFYSIFGLEYRFRLGTRPENFMGDTKVWEKAESELKDILEKSGKQFFVEEGDGAFYGPKIDILMKDALGREWQMGTLQLDFQIPLRFKLKYTSDDGSLKTPIVIHRVIYGSLERFVGLITEHFAGSFPVWLSPVQVKILPISEKHIAYAKEVLEKLMEKGIRVEVDERNETLNAKIRDAQLSKVPYMLILGDKETETKQISVRMRDNKKYPGTDLHEFTNYILDKVAQKALEL